MPYDFSAVDALAQAFLAGPFDAESLAIRGARVIGRTPRPWLVRLARRFVAQFASRTRPRKRDVFEFLLHDPVLSRLHSRLKVQLWITDEDPAMHPVEAARGWPVPPIESPIRLANWLNLPLTELEWFADLDQYLKRSHTPAALRHYHYRILKKDAKNIRLIEAPKDRLKKIQRKILTEILDVIPPHAAVHGFRKGHSIQTLVAPHTAQRVVLKMDLTDFFPSISGARVQALFRTIGYPETVADLLGGLSTTITPREVLRENTIYATPHLPQGAPTSPAIANLCAYRFDARLAGLAQAAGANYTRYADDLAFSGGPDFNRAAERFSIHAAAILLEEGFTVHHRKTRIMRQAVRQQLAGLVTNSHANIRRSDFDCLKATLTNCVREGPASQNREHHPDFQAHLAGRIGFVESVNPAKGARLRTIFHRIVW